MLLKIFFTKCALKRCISVSAKNRI